MKNLEFHSRIVLLNVSCRLEGYTVLSLWTCVDHHDFHARFSFHKRSLAKRIHSQPIYSGHSRFVAQMQNALKEALASLSASVIRWIQRTRHKAAHHATVSLPQCNTARHCLIRAYDTTQESDCQVQSTAPSTRAPPAWPRRQTVPQRTANRCPGHRRRRRSCICVARPCPACPLPPLQD